MLADNPDQQAAKPQKKESFLANLLLNIVIPSVILSKFSNDEYLGVTTGVVVALAFPLLYGMYDFWQMRKINFFSILGFISVLLTGGISLLQLDPQYIAIKEAAIPGLFGLVTLISIRTRFPLVRTFIYNDKILQVDKINSALNQNNTHTQFEKVLHNATLLIAASFFLSSFLNYVLAKIIMVSPAGTAEFNAELGKMTALSYPVIALPMMIILMGTLFYIFKNIKKLTGLTLEEVVNDGSN
jgi:intracellular septation protein A